MSDNLSRIPRWALIAALTLTMPVVGWALNAHVHTDAQQTADIHELVKTASSLSEATSNLKDIVKMQGEEIRILQTELLRRQRRSEPTTADAK